MSLEYMKAVDATEDSMYAANTAGSNISVLLGGTNVPLPSIQNLSSFTVNPGNDTFTVPLNGRYLIAYQINVTAALAVSSRIVRNGSALAGSIIDPVLNLSSFQNTMIANLNQGDTISLQLAGLIGTATLIGGGSTGAALNIIRLA